MKKFLLVLITISLLAALWFSPLFSALSGYVIDCTVGPDLTGHNDKENLLRAQQNYHICLLVLEKNNKMFKDSGWKKLSADELYRSQYGYSMMAFTPDRFKLIRESNAILDQIVLDTMVIASYNGKMYKNREVVDKGVKKTAKTLAPYRAYIETNNTMGVLEAHKRFVYNKYINTHQETSSKLPVEE